MWAGGAFLGEVTGTGTSGIFELAGLALNSQGHVGALGGTLDVRIRAGAGQVGQTIYDGFSLTAVPVPEPSSLVLAAMGLLGLPRRGRRRRRRL